VDTKEGIPFIYSYRYIYIYIIFQISQVLHSAYFLDLFIIIFFSGIKYCCVSLIVSRFSVTFTPTDLNKSSLYLTDNLCIICYFSIIYDN